MKLLFLDVESWDPTLKKYSSGSVLKYHYPEIPFEVLGVGVITHDKEEIYFNLLENKEDNLEILLKIINDHDILVGHNILYDLSCLKFLYRYVIDLEKFLKIDTMLLAKMVDQHLGEKIKFSKSPYSLDALCKWYKISEHKESEILADFAWISGLYKEWYGNTHPKKMCIKCFPKNLQDVWYEMTPKLTCKKCDGTGQVKANVHTRPSKKIMNNYCITHLKDFPIEIVSNYCLQDNRATKGLYNKLMPMLDEKHDLQMISDVIDVCLVSKFRGMRIDLKAAKQLSKEWLEIASKAENNFLLGLGNTEVKINSVAQIAPILEDKGFKIPRTEKGNYSIDKDWLAEQTDPLFKDLALYRKARKNEKDFIQKMIQYQEIIPEKYRDPDIGWMYPTMKVLGATATGRFTSGGGQYCNELNMLAISAHDEVFGKPVRKLFIPHEGEKIICFDYSNQEPRIMAHYAKVLNCEGIDPVIEEWNANPKMKYHQKVKEMTGLEYSVAKTITLGLAYDMRAKGLSEALGITFKEAEKLIEKYFNLIPFLKQLQEITASNLKRLGYIRSLGGRKLYIDPAYEFKGRVRTQERKAMSKLVQGSAADMTIKAMIRCHKAGLKVLLSVHDEIIITSNKPQEDFKTMQDCLEGAYKLLVPLVAEGGIGDNWGDSKV